MASFSGRVRVGTLTAPNNTTDVGVASQVVVRQDWTAPTAIDLNGHGAAIDIGSAGSTSTPVGALLWVNDFARACQIDLSGAGTPDITIDGLDQWGNVVQDVITGNGTTPVLGAVAMKSITKITWEALSSETLDVGDTDKLGLDYKITEDTVFWELEDQVAATAGGVVTGAATANTDARGTYDPNSALDASIDLTIYYVVNDIDSLT